MPEDAVTEQTNGSPSSKDSSSPRRSRSRSTNNSTEKASQCSPLDSPSPSSSHSKRRKRSKKSSRRRSSSRWEAKGRSGKCRRISRSPTPLRWRVARNSVSNRSKSTSKERRRNRNKHSRSRSRSRSYSRDKCKRSRKSRSRTRSLERRTKSRRSRSNSRRRSRHDRSRSPRIRRTSIWSRSRSRSRSRRGRSLVSSQESSTTACGSSEDEKLSSLNESPSETTACLLKNTKVVAALNVSLQASKTQLMELFSFFGRIKDLAVFPPVQDLPFAPDAPYRICMVKYASSSSSKVALHLTGTVFLNRSLIVVPCEVSEIPDSEKVWETVCAGWKQLVEASTTTSQIGKDNQSTYVKVESPLQNDDKEKEEKEDENTNESALDSLNPTVSDNSIPTSALQRQSLQKIIQEYQSVE